MNLSNLPDIKHPYTDYSLIEAVNLAVENAKMFDRKVPQSLEAVRDYINDMASRSGHNWMTGAAALDVLDAAIDGKDLRSNCRFL